MFQILFLVFMFAAMYFLMIAPQRKKQKEHEKMLASLQSGDEVMTTGAWSCVARATGKPFTAQWAMRFRFTGDKVSFAHVYEDTAVTAAALR